MTRMQYRLAAFVLGVLVAAAATPSKGAPLTFTWNPSGASPALGGAAFTADTIFTTNALIDVGQTNGTGLAHYISVITGFALGGAPVAPAGFGSSYGLYFEVADTHTFGPPPNVILVSSINLALKADPGNLNGAAFATVGGVGFANTGATGQADDVTLATGSRVGSSTYLDVATGVLDADAITTLLPAAGEAGFFASPLLDGSLLLDTHSVNPANLVNTPQPNGTTITTFNNFNSTAQFVPEPGSILLLMTGLVGVLPWIRRR